jgi:hypothetical protein
MEVRWRRVMYDLIMVGEVVIVDLELMVPLVLAGDAFLAANPRPSSSRYPFGADGVAARRSETANGGTSANNPPFERLKRSRDGRGFHNGQQEDCQDWVLENRHYRFPAPCADDATPPPVTGSRGLAVLSPDY